MFVSVRPGAAEARPSILRPAHHACPLHLGEPAAVGGGGPQARLPGREKWTDPGPSLRIERLLSCLVACLSRRNQSQADRVLFCERCACFHPRLFQKHRKWVAKNPGETSSPEHPPCFTGDDLSVIGLIVNSGVSVGCSPLPAPRSLSARVTD